MIVKNLSNFLTWWRGLSFIKFTGIFLLLSFAAKVATAGLVFIPFFTIEDEPIVGLEDMEKGLPYGIAVLVALMPIVETFLYQYLPIIIVNKFSKNKYLQVFISAILFGLGHITHSISYAIFAIFTGVVLATGFILYKENHSTQKAFWVTALVHGLFNLVSVLLMLVFPEEILFS
ncbi:MAG: CPBP family intramembrane metalloprotease [Bacteroidales bacterium]|jgi:membrane protease YdiL (CAAX protease family)|nr:CPBP family intramembrane metalloprotease [Bacteroidales bacterium]